jgi:hypothetical protein
MTKVAVPPVRIPDIYHYTTPPVLVKAILQEIPQGIVVHIQI